MQAKRIQAEHGIVCRMADREEGYFGWPSIARADDGRLLVVASGPRVSHLCPFGKVSILESLDEGRTWSPPRVISDTPLDDRDAGIVSLGPDRLLVSSFTVDSRVSLPSSAKHWSDPVRKRAMSLMGTWTDPLMRDWLTPYVLLSEDGGREWSKPIRTPVSTPHGPIRLRDGSLLYLGWYTQIARRFPRPADAASAGTPDVGHEHDAIRACRSTDGGRTWAVVGEVPPAPGTRTGNYFEPHVVELPDGKLIALLRFSLRSAEDRASPAGIDFSMYQTQSDDGGVTWSTARPLGVYGSPPHLMRHSWGALVCSYSYRKPPLGQRVMISRDGGTTWDADWILRDDAPHKDLGYPCSVELADGAILTVYYQKVAANEPCSLLWSRWRLPRE